MGAPKAIEKTPNWIAAPVSGEGYPVLSRALVVPDHLDHRNVGPCLQWAQTVWPDLPSSARVALYRRYLWSLDQEEGG